MAQSFSGIPLIRILVQNLLKKPFIKKLVRNLPQLIFVLLFELFFINRVAPMLLMSVLAYVVVILLFMNVEYHKAFLIVLVFSQIIACAILFAKFPVNPDLIASDPWDYNRIGKNLLKYKVYTDDTVENTNNVISNRVTLPDNLGNTPNLTTYRPVGYPVFIALVYLISGTTNYRAVILVQYILYILTTLLFWTFIKNVSDKKTATIATSVYQLNIPLLFMANSFWTETLAQFLLLVSVYCAERIWKKGDKLVHSIFLGLAGGFLVLVRPVFSIYIPLAAIGYLLTWAVKKRVQFTQLVVLILLIGIPSVWAIRNTYVAGKLTSFSTNGGINIFLGNNPYIINGRAAYWPPKEYVDETLQGLGNIEVPDKNSRAFLESTIDSMYQKAGIKWAAKNPQRFISLAISKLQFIFLPIADLSANLQHFNTPSGYQYSLILLVQSAIFWLLLLFSMVGITNKNSLLFTLISLPYIALVLLNFGEARFQVPLYIPIAYISTIGLTKSLSFVKKTKKQVKVQPWKVFLYFVLFIILISHFHYFNSTILNPYKMVVYEKSKTSAFKKMAEYKGALPIKDYYLCENSENCIAKKYTEDKYLDAHLYYKGEVLNVKELLNLTKTKEVLTSDIDIFNRLDIPEVKDMVILEYKDAFHNNPLVALKDKGVLDGLQPKDIPTNTSMVLPAQKQYILKNKEISPEIKYVAIAFHIERNSYIEITGKQKIRIKPYTKTDGFIDTEIYFPAKFFLNGLSVACVNNPLPTYPQNISVDSNNRYTWGAGNVQLVRITTYQ